MYPKRKRLSKESIAKEKDTTQAFWEAALSRKDGDVYQYPFEDYPPKPAVKRYTIRINGSTKEAGSIPGF